MGGMVLSERHPTPWTLTHWDQGCIIHDAQGDMVETVYTGREIAEQIVTSANSHAALVKALTNLVAMDSRALPTPYGHDCQWCGACCGRAVADANEALALVQNSEPSRAKSGAS